MKAEKMTMHSRSEMERRIREAVLTENTECRADVRETRDIFCTCAVDAAKKRHDAHQCATCRMTTAALRRIAKRARKKKRE